MAVIKTKVIGSAELERVPGEISKGFVRNCGVVLDESGDCKLGGFMTFFEVF